MEKFILSPADIEELADLLHKKLCEKMEKPVQPKPVQSKPVQAKSSQASIFEEKINMKNLISRRKAEVVLNLKRGSMDHPRYSELCTMVKVNNKVYYTIESVLNYKKNYSRK